MLVTMEDCPLLAGSGLPEGQAEEGWAVPSPPSPPPAPILSGTLNSY